MGSLNDFTMLPSDVDEDPAHVALELEHFGLILCAHAYSTRNGTDGFVPDKAVRGFGARGDGPKLADELVVAGIWERRTGGFYAPSFLAVNPTAAERAAKRFKERKRKQEQRERDVQAPSHEEPSPGARDDASSSDADASDGRHAGHPMGQDVGRPSVEERREEKREDNPPNAGAGAREYKPEPGALTPIASAGDLTPKRISAVESLMLATGEKLVAADEWEKFVLHHRHGGGLSADWDATWEKWLRNAAKFAKSDRHKGRRARPIQRDPPGVRAFEVDSGVHDYEAIVAENEARKAVKGTGT